MIPERGYDRAIEIKPMATPVKIVGKNVDMTNNLENESLELDESEGSFNDENV